MKSQVLQGNNVDVLRTFPDNHFDSIVTDPPYGIDFLGKAWDANTGALEIYQECLRVLKPGGHIVAFSAARTYHHLAVTIEQAGFEIRDQIMWIYSSGFPKSQDVGRQMQKAIYGKPDKQRFDPDIMIKVSGDQYQHPDSDKIYRKLPDINGDRLKKSHEGEGYGCVFEEVMDIKYDKIVDTTKNAGFGQTDHARVRAGEEWSTQATAVGQVKVIDPVAQQWSGWGTALKPAHEPIVLARKPIKTSIRENCLKWGVGALHIDATRVPFADENDQPGGGENGWSRVGFSEQPVEKYQDQKKKKSDVEIYLNNKRGPMERARIQDGENIGMFDGGVGYKAIKRAVDPEQDLPEGGRFPSNVIGEIADYQKYFYCPKVGRAERHIGHELPAAMFGAVQGAYGPDGNRMAVGLDARTDANKGNNHPTVKPIELMKYLIRLITPAGGRVLDPFNGSGSTGCAAVELDYDYTGIELDPAYVAIAERRIAAWYQHTHPLQASGFFE